MVVITVEQSSGSELPPEFPPPCQGSGEPCLEFVTHPSYNFCGKDANLIKQASFG